MRLYPALSKIQSRPIPQEPVPFREILPLKLKPKVSGKGGKTSEVCCVHEMSVMFACLKENEFQQAPCGKEIEGFQKCYNNHLTNKNLKMERETKGFLIPGEKNLPAKQLNKILSSYPKW